MPTAESNAALVSRTFEALNRHDAQAAARLWSADAHWVVPGKILRGPQQVAAYFEDFFAALPDFHLEVIAMAERGADVLVHWRMTGRHTGRLDGVDGTGRSLSLHGMDHLVVRGEQIVSNMIVCDQLEAARQVGAMPALDSRADRAMKTMVNARTRLALRRLRRAIAV